MSVIYHTGLTPPPSVALKGLEISHYPVLKVEYTSNNVPKDVIDILKLEPIVLLMSKNAVIGLNKWCEQFGLDSNFFAGANFWTVGDMTHAFLKDTLGIQSFYPDKMTGEGVIEALENQNHSRVLLISGQDPRQEFIEGLSGAQINFFHFCVYKIHVEKNIEFSDHFTNAKSDYLLITSPSSVDGILQSLSLLDLSGFKSRIISIGPTTSAAIRKNGGDVFIESEIPNITVLYNNLDSLIASYTHS